MYLVSEHEEAHHCLVIYAEVWPGWLEHVVCMPARGPSGLYLSTYLNKPHGDAVVSVGRVHKLSYPASRALNAVLQDEDIIGGMHSEMLDNVLAWLTERTGRAADEEALYEELSLLPAEVRASFGKQLRATPV